MTLPEYSIKILLSQEIEKEKWNACLLKAGNNIIYAQYDYLQCLTDHWSGIIVNDYEAIMPLPFRRKWGVRYCYDVPFVQQLGLFGKYDNNLLKQVVKTATTYIRYGDLFFNFQNDVTQILPNIRMAENYILPLSSSYKNIHNNYTKHLKTKLKKAQNSSFIINDNDDITKAVFWFTQLYLTALPNIKADNYNRLIKAAIHFLETKQCFAYSISDRKQNLLAIALFFKDDNRIYNILPSTTQEGRKLNAMHYLLDSLIQQYAETQYCLDFEGSDVAGIKTFYQSFGAVNQPYFHYHFNHLPFPFRLLKR